MLHSSILLIGCLVIAITLAVVGSTSSSQTIYATNPRQNRGFKGGSISTARGFGKRGYNGKNSYIEPVIVTEDDNQQIGDERYPNDWLIEELQKNPETAKIIVDKIIDQNRDGELAPEELFNKVYY